MSKQLALSAVFSVFTMAAFALFATAADVGNAHAEIASAETLVPTPHISFEAFAPTP
jgi:hypothetical protein